MQSFFEAGSLYIVLKFGKTKDNCPAMRACTIYIHLAILKFVVLELNIANQVEAKHQTTVF